MAAEWRRSTIGDLCDAGLIDLQTGPFGTQLHAFDYVEDGTPVVPTEAIRGRQIDHSVLPKISSAKAGELVRHRLRPGDILFARRGVQATGHVGFVREAEEGFICGTGAIRLRVSDGSEEVSPDFLSLVLANPAAVEWFKFHSIGATMPNLNEGIIRSFPLAIPSAPEQRAIAHILGTLDDKIELNRRMNETLEAMARALFKSWFVDFDAVRAKAEGPDPGLPKPLAELLPDRLVNSELGEIPEGWTVRSLDEIAHFLNGLALQKYPPRDDRSLPVIKIAQLRAGNTVGADAASSDLEPEYIVENGDVLFSWSGSLECTLWPGGRGALNQHLFKVTSVEFPKWLYYLWIQQHLDEFRHIAAGKATTMGHIQRHHLSDAKVIVPPSRVLHLIDSMMSPLIDGLWSRSVQSRILAAMRDTLLPRLISGELRAGARAAQETLKSA